LHAVAQLGVLAAGASNDHIGCPS